MPDEETPINTNEQGEEEPVESAPVVPPEEPFEEALPEVPAEATPEIISEEVSTEEVNEPIEEATPIPAEPDLAEPVVREVIKEIEKPLTDADKDKIFHDKLKENLTQANTKKQEKFESNLLEIVDFMKRKGTLVTNQDIEEGLKIPDSTVTKRLNDLVKRGLVVRLGDQYHAKYKLKDSL